jgi:uncharacterized protein YndB with AHSA1/START domain
MEKPKFVYVIYIATTPEKLWQALTNPEFRTKYWFGMRFDGEMRVGSKLTSTDSAGKVVATGQVLESDPPRRLSCTFHAKNEMVRHEPATRVTYELEPVGREVRLTVTHDEFGPGSHLFHGVSIFWPKLLSSLKSFLETGTPLDITQESQTGKKSS